jgi:pimeloyl-ACP methyl ester carboxylesterase
MDKAASSGVTRRQFLTYSASVLAMGVSGCCDHAPSIATPVFFGYKDYGTADGAPAAVRVFFPSLDGTPRDAAIYSDCARYPLIMFLHGDDTTHLSWFDLPAQLARAGFLVVVPESTSAPGDTAGALDIPTHTLRWMRHRTSPFAKVYGEPIGLCGHSHGATQALLLAEQGGIAAFAALSGAWAALSAGPQFSRLSCPSLLAWGTEDLLTLFTKLDIHNPTELALWNTVPRPKHNLQFVGAGHYDYIPLGSLGFSQPPGVFRGTCTLVPEISTDFLTSFFSKYMPPVGYYGNNIPDSLIPPPLDLNPQQELLAGGFLPAFTRYNGQSLPRECSGSQYWETNNAVQPTGTLTFH